jgi:hypothetical protein
VWCVYRDKQDKDLRYFAPSKTNDCVDPTTVAFRIAKPDGRVQIESTSVNKTADDFMIAERQQFPPGPAPEERRKCEQRLSEVLATGGKPQIEIMDLLQGEGFSESTIKRAKKALCIKPKKEHFSGGWTWHLPLISSPPEDGQHYLTMFGNTQEGQDTVMAQNTENIGT